MNVEEMREKIAETLARTPHLSRGIGTTQRPCTIAAINLAVTGTLTDERLTCVCPVIHSWVICVQDAAPSELCRDNPGWRSLAPLIAGSVSSGDVVYKRVEYLASLVWDVVLPMAQPVADLQNFGEVWRKMREMKTEEAARAAARAAWQSHMFAMSQQADYSARVARNFYTGRTGTLAAREVASASASVAAVATSTMPDRCDVWAVWTAYDPIKILKALLEIK